MDSVGNIPIFLSVLKETSPKRHPWIIFRELLIALGIILFFYFLGGQLLDFMDIQEHSIMISGGIILFLIALKMVFPPQAAHHHPRDHGDDKEPFIVPLAIPLVAGPAVLAAVILYSHEAIPALHVIPAIVMAWTASTIVLLCSSLIRRALGMRGITALERLMGLLLTMIAVEMFLQGLHHYLSYSNGS